jgi:eukaryotic-like serine/threonine-protein kinase
MDKDFLFGVMAVQLGLASPQQVMAAAAAYFADRSRAIPQRLEADGVLTAERARMLEAMVADAIAAHGGDVKRNMATVGGERALFASFGGSVVLDSEGGIAAAQAQEAQAEDPTRVSSEDPSRYTFKGGAPEAAEIGRGGMGRILVAYDEHVGREIAVKELLADAGSGGSPAPGDLPVGRTAAAASRFLREARVTGQLEHPSIVPVYEVGRRADGKLYYTMRLVRGRSLAAAIRDCSTLAERLKLLPHFVDLCQAVAYAHSRGVVHRDLKPENAMLGEFGETVVLDWGLAKVRGKADIRGGELARDLALLHDAGAGQTVDGSAIGTPAYMSPEQADGKVEEIDERSDVWSLGAVLYEVLTGRPPFEGFTPFEVMGKVLKDEVVSPRALDATIPAELAAIALKALSRDKADRYQSAKLMAEEVSAWLTGGRVGAYEYGSWELLKRFVRRNRALSTAVLVVFLVTVTGLLLVWRMYARAEDARKETFNAKIQVENRERIAHLNLANGYMKTAERFIRDKDFSGARIFASAAILHNPFNPNSQWHFLPGEQQAHRDIRGGLSSFQSQLYDSIHHSLVDYVTSWKIGCDHQWVLALSPDSRFAAYDCCNDNEKGCRVMVRDLAGGSENRISYGDIARPRGIAFDPSSTRISIGMMSGEIRVYEVQSRRLVKSIITGSTALADVKYSPDGQHIASLSVDNFVRLWDTATGSLTAEHGGLTKIRPYSELAFSDNGRSLAIADWDSVAVWDLDGNRLSRLPNAGHTGTFWTVAFLGNSSVFAGTYLGQTIEWQRNGKEYSLVTVYDTLLSTVSEVVWLPSIQSIVAAGYRDNALVVLGDNLTKPVNRISRGTRFVNVASSKDGTRLAAMDDDGGVIVWKVGKDESLKRYGRHSCALGALAMSIDGKHIASSACEYDQFITVTALADIETEYLSRYKNPESVHEGEEMSSLVFSPDARFLVSMGVERKKDRTFISLWDIAEGKIRFDIDLGNGDGYGNVAMSPDGKYLANGDGNGRLSFRETATGHQTKGVTAKVKRINSVAFAPDGQTVACGGENGVEIFVWPAAEAMEKMDAGHSISKIAYSPDGRRIASASGRVVKIWDLSNGRHIVSMEGHDHSVEDVSWSPSGKYLVTSGQDKKVMVWESGTGAPVQYFEAETPVEGALFSPDEKNIIYNDNRTVRIVPFEPDLWRKDPEKLLEEAEKALGARLDGFELKPME